jgi:uncharacterized protein
MKPKQIIIGLVIGIISITIFYNLFEAQTQNAGNFAEKIKQIRKDKDYFFKTSEKSPIKDRPKFKGLLYYPPKENYKVKAQLELIDNQQFIEIKTSTELAETYQKFAWAKFRLNGTEQKLLVLKKPRMPQLFVAFSDETSGKTTYGGGRYLDFPFQKGATSLIIDFNLAYNPYCVYNPDYSCPLPPAENHLPIALEVGERVADK